MTKLQLTDERIEQLERTQTYDFVTHLIHDLRLYKQQAEERGEALERIRSNCVGWKRPADLIVVNELVFKIADQALEKEQTP
jgi:hypothetical protein